MLTAPASDRFYRNIAIAIFAALAVIILLTFRHYGISWDEELQSQYGLAVVDYYLSGLKDDRYQEIFNLYFYGGMFDGLASLIDRLMPFMIYETRHLINALFGLLGLWGTWRLARFVGGYRVALLALIFLALTPVYYGHMFNNPKDIPFATGIVWSLYFMSRILSEAPNPKNALLVKLGIILGLTLGVRVGGVMIFAFWLAPFGLWCLRPFKKASRQERLKLCVNNILRAGFTIILPVAIISYIVMLICWPWAQQSPIINPLRALSEFSNFPQDVEVLLDGTIYRSTELPWSYVPLYFGIQLPEFVLLLLALGFAAMPLIWKKCDAPQRQGLLLILLTALLPPTFAVIHHSALYDAMRHFLFVVPLLCIFAAVTADTISQWAIAQCRHARARQIVTYGLAGILTLFIAVQVTIMVRLHPYEYIYANRFAGGVAGAYGRYETDYWGISFKEAAEQLQKFVIAEGGIPAGKIYRIAVCGPWSAAMIYMPPNYDPVIANAPAEFFLSTTRWQCQNMRPGKEIVHIERMGAPLAIVKDLRDGYEYYEGNKHLKPAH